MRTLEDVPEAFRKPIDLRNAIHRLHESIQLWERKRKILPKPGKLPLPPMLLPMPDIRQPLPSGKNWQRTMNTGNKG